MTAVVSCTKHLFEHEFRKGRPPTQQHKGSLKIVFTRHRYLVLEKRCADRAQAFCLTLCPFHQRLPAPQWVSYDVCQSYVLHGPCGCPRYWWPWQQPASRLLKQSSHAFHCWRCFGDILQAIGQAIYVCAEMLTSLTKRSISSWLTFQHLATPRFKSVFAT